MHKNGFHAVLSPRIAGAVSLTVAAQRHAMTTTAQTAKRFCELYAQSQHFIPAFLPLCAIMLALCPIFATNSLTPADLHTASASAAKAVTLSFVPAELLQ